MTPNSAAVDEERRIAHSGGLARFARHCAQHPWRVIGTWLSVIVSLIVLNVFFHGTLINDFKVPGTDFQKATDLINAKFGGQKGAALRVVLKSENGDRLDLPAPAAAIARMTTAANSSTRELDTSAKDVSTIANPVAQGAHTLAKDGTIAYFDTQYDKTG